MLVFSGVGKYSPDAAVRGDMGWKTPLHHQRMCGTRVSCRLSVMPNERLTRRVILWANNLAQGNKKKQEIVYF